MHNSRNDFNYQSYIHNSRNKLFSEVFIELVKVIVSGDIILVAVTTA